MEQYQNKNSDFTNLTWQISIYTFIQTTFHSNNRHKQFLD